MVGYALLGFELCALESSNHSLTIVRAGPDHVELIYRRTAAYVGKPPTAEITEPSFHLMEVLQKTYEDKTVGGGMALDL
jgi:hypothetical protein